MDFTILGDWNSILHVNKCLAQSQPKDGRENEKILKYLKRNVRRGSKGGVKSPQRFQNYLLPLPFFPPSLEVFPPLEKNFAVPVTCAQSWDFFNFYLPNLQFSPLPIFDPPLFICTFPRKHLHRLKGGEGAKWGFLGWQNLKSSTAKIWNPCSILML